MTISHSELTKVAHLAQLTIPKDELEVFNNEVNRVLALVEQMNQYDTSGIQPMAHHLDAQVKLRLREDNITETNQQLEAIALAPEHEAGLYLVPKAVDAKATKEDPHDQ